MSVGSKPWDMGRVEQLRASMSDAEIAALKAKGKSKAGSLTIDEVGVLFLVTRERIRELERLAGEKGGDQ
jgi:DNA-directed RNA polymerase sigma subunit (sigma70/sigma32)